MGRGLDVKDPAKDKAKSSSTPAALPPTTQASGRVAAAAVSLLKKAGVDVAVAGDKELCCGGRAYEMGYRDQAVKQAELNVARFKESGATELVTGCAHCYQYFKVLYPKLGLDHGLKVTHITEYLAGLVSDGTLKPTKPVDMTVTYHDPCHLGRLSEPWIEWKGVQRDRHMRVYDPPRVLRRGPTVSTSRRGTFSRASRASSSWRWTASRSTPGAAGPAEASSESNPEFAAFTAAERVAEAESTGAEALVSACPHCIQNLAGNAGDLKVYDVVEILDKAI